MKKVLICDDEPHILESVSYVVHKLGHQCLTATNGEEALRAARQDQPDVLVLDVRMPKLDGYSVCEQLKSEVATRGIYIIMLTAFGQKQDERIAASVGADEFMTKPFSPRWLKVRLSKILGNAEEKQ
jgi:DNA-binding response OmpR family regulator